jgi:hypothetical protein
MIRMSTAEEKDIDRLGIKRLQSRSKMRVNNATKEAASSSSSSLIVLKSPISEIRCEQITIDSYGKPQKIHKAYLTNSLYEVGWVLDGHSPSCMVCTKGFSFFNRRHHCRKCGYLVCGTCSKNKYVLRGLWEMGGSRVCDKCVTDSRKSDCWSWQQGPFDRAETINGDIMGHGHGVLGSHRIPQVHIDSTARRSMSAVDANFYQSERARIERERERDRDRDWEKQRAKSASPPLDLEKQQKQQQQQADLLKEQEIAREKEKESERVHLIEQERKKHDKKDKERKEKEEKEEKETQESIKGLNDVLESLGNLVGKLAIESESKGKEPIVVVDSKTQSPLSLSLSPHVKEGVTRAPTTIPSALSDKSDKSDQGSVRSTLSATSSQSEGTVGSGVLNEAKLTGIWESDSPMSGPFYGLIDNSALTKSGGSYASMTSSNYTPFGDHLQGMIGSNGLWEAGSGMGSVQTGAEPDTISPPVRMLGKEFDCDASGAVGGGSSPIKKTALASGFEAESEGFSENMRPLVNWRN